MCKKYLGAFSTDRGKGRLLVLSATTSRSGKKNEGVITRKYNPYRVSALWGNMDCRIFQFQFTICFYKNGYDA